jgi:hypothetical protein
LFLIESRVFLLNTLGGTIPVSPQGITREFADL